ncbi:hypothetical protein [Kribbella sp. DT2]|uniref:hypothetical protein n=1 Tax=Kribbella sp. DT2 TaxID=3393427 RepID=UPI003CF6633B
MTTDEPDFAHRQGIGAARRVGARLGLTVAMRRLDPAFHRRHISDVVVSRALAENALQDLERQGGDFPLVHAYRRVASRVDPADTVAGFRVLTEYLRSRGVPVGRPGSRVTVLDTSFKGTVQELLAAIHPETNFRGKYAFLAESPDDPHPGSKQGYEVHLRQGRRGRASRSTSSPRTSRRRSRTCSGSTRSRSCSTARCRVRSGSAGTVPCRRLNESGRICCWG